MNELNRLLKEIKQTLNSNNSYLNSEDNHLQSLSQKCENLCQKLSEVDNILDNQLKIRAGIETLPLEEQKILKSLNLNEINCDNLKKQLEEVLKLANNDNEELVNKIKDAEKELTEIFNNLKNQQTIINNYQARINQLETKINASDKQAKILKIKVGLIGVGIGGGLIGLLTLIIKFKDKFKKD